MIAVLAQIIAAIETRLLGYPVIEALVLAILLGMSVRTAWTLPSRVERGVRFAAKEVLEVAVLLLGASVSFPLLLEAGAPLALGIVLLVVFGLAASYLIARALALPAPLATLIACGNAICGNSAIAAIAPVIGADEEHVSSAITFTAILGVIAVLGLPLLVGPMKLSQYQYGVLAGLTVYAVPQVLAATFPVSALSGQVGTLVKLVRVLMLGPVVLFFALRARLASPLRPRARQAHGAGDERHANGARGTSSRPALVPWFIVGFLALAALRSGGVLPDAVSGWTQVASGGLTVIAMAALGLSTDLLAVRRVGPRVIVAVTGSLLTLMLLAWMLIRVVVIG